MNRQFVQEITTTLTKQVGLNRRLASPALALSIAFALPLPNGAVEDPASFYVEHYESKVRAFANDFNERFLIDIGAVIEGTREVWINRYRFVHIHDEAQISAVMNGLNPIAQFLSGFEQTVEESALIVKAIALLRPQIECHLTEAGTH